MDGVPQAGLGSPEAAVLRTQVYVRVDVGSSVEATAQSQESWVI